MYSTLARLINDLDTQALSGTDVIRWGAPVPAFGDPRSALVATLGLNPSNREFVDEEGRELKGKARRFHTLSSLGLTSWKDADSRHLERVVRSCYEYFLRNPYDRWFRRLDGILRGIDTSYYSIAAGKDRPARAACHLDLIPYATHRKWIELSNVQRAKLLERSGRAFGSLVRDSSISLLVLNGRSVVDHFESLIDQPLIEHEHADWALPRESGSSVRGISYRGTVTSIAGEDLGRELLVVGFNHNIQSSYGVTAGVTEAITHWLAVQARGWIE